MPELNDHIEWLLRSAERMAEATKTLQEPALSKFLQKAAQTHLECAQELVKHISGGDKWN